MGPNSTAGVPGRAAASAILGRAGAARPGTSGRRAVIALVLASTLLACHGLFGAHHVLGHGAPPQAAAPTADLLAPPGSTGAAGHAVSGFPSGAHHAAGVPDEGGHRDPPGPSSVDAGYFAVLLALAGAALLAALFGRCRTNPTASWRSPATLRVPRTLPLPRGPSPPLLQVFRL